PPSPTRRTIRYLPSMSWPKDGSCINEPNTNECSDGDPCTTNDRCSKGTCKGSPIGCNDNNPCTSDSCENGNCVFEPVDDGAECDDQNGCTSGDQCKSGVCVGTGGPDCDDGNPCTKNSCSNSECSWDDLEPEGTPCVQENKCLVNTTCSAEGECTSDVEKDCDDNNPCTVDSCDPDVGCVHEPLDGDECNDGNACTLEDRCVEGECVGEVPVQCAPLDECHVAGTCDPLTGACSDPRKPDGEPCENTGTCEAGKCVGGTPTPIGEGGAGGEPGHGEGGAPDGAAGDDDGAGGAGDTDSSEGGAPNAPGSTGDGGDSADPTPSSEVFQRKSGGCAVASGPAKSATWPALLLGALGLGVLRRRRASGRAAH
ncbi:MAG: MYXO-CTERM sorting domain-containing protein, partial [Pseudomonadota bacterium]